ncbi:hypothetical protein T552_01712 [Pneumocystis carinii B80]|uniref:DUF1753 domain-containing protein n=1 Tax=Pneumocystis carinii (strain B80) TaxID=1408658 RepID=A0A0W4ZJA9_PNEC8|nr:hypothetical protein T552_01712 [Pneumocystis carinii B80]KTW28450.1 hypothetical protein T552_01712 [Pneumocystis carinii B80]
MLRVKHFEIPKPRSFLYFLDLKIGTELIIFFSILNKASGIYGFFVTLINYSSLSMSLWKMFMYFYSLLVLLGFTMMMKYIRTESPFHILICAYFYFIDTFISSIYSAIFTIVWFMNIFKHAIISSGAGKLVSSQKSEIIELWSSNNSEYAHDSSMMFFSIENLFTVFILCFFLCLKIYFCLVVFSYARYLLLRTGNIYKYLRNERIKKLVSLLTYGKYWEKADDTFCKIKCSLDLNVFNAR